MTEDWADELIFAGIDAETLRRIERKAEAKGMREAARIWESCEFYDEEFVSQLLAKADNIERGNPL